MISAFCLAPPNLELEKSYKKIKWEDYLEAIAYVESRFHVMAQDPSGVYFGRGYYQIGEMVLSEYKKNNADMYWVTPEMLYNTNIAKPIALWYLGKLESDFRKLGYEMLIIPCVISGYNRGLTGTLRYGIRASYVKDVLDCKDQFEKQSKTLKVGP